MTDQTSPTALSHATNLVIPFPVGAGKSRATATYDIYNEAQDGMPIDFSRNGDGIYQLRPDEDGDLIPVRICSPLVVKGICRTSNSEEWGSVVSVQDLDGVWHEMILNARDTESKSTATLNALFDKGLKLTSVDKAAQSVKELLANWRPDVRYLRARRLGWTDESFTSFALGNGRVLGEANVVVDAISDDVANSMHEKGTIDDWRAAVATPRGGSVCLNRFRAFRKWFSALVTPLPLWASAG